MIANFKKSYGLGVTVKHFIKRPLRVALLSMLLSLVSQKHAQCGEGFFDLLFTNDIAQLNVSAVDADTLLPLPATFSSNAEGEYQVSGLLVLDNDVTSPIGTMQISGHERGEFISTLSVLGGADNGLALFAGWIVGIEIEDIDVEDARKTVDAQLSGLANSLEGEFPVDSSVDMRVFVDTTDDVEVPVDAATVGGFITKDKPWFFASYRNSLPAIPDQSNANAYDTVVMQSGAGFFDIPLGSVFDVELVSDLRLISVSESADFDNDGDTDGNDFFSWQRGNSPNPLSAEDLDRWESHFSHNLLQVTSIATEVPEPNACLILLVGMVALLAGNWARV